ncbi:recombinase family protein [Caulobacter sp. RL271]|uniref:Recombinase family protein n=1 Tax=Caulobacter segnis TaxID=88688 RepID=A0ABY4ZT78_9CAUL|nr:recombinase family protein [Caulobacter segnis]USQ95885.1 recombinase family protein [Caulobacter segnis]
MKAVAYFRVSTQAQGRSGLGLEAQEAAVLDYAGRVDATVIATFTEVESGKRNSRPQLEAALRFARQTGAVLLIAKLDRLSRNAAFLLTLRDSGVRFRAADMPDASDLTIGLMAVIAQAEREAISKRTKEALAVVKHRLRENGEHTSQRSGRTIGRLGNPNGTRHLRHAGRSNSAAIAALKANADGRALELASQVERLRAEGITSFSQLAKALNRTGILTPRRGRWHAATVRALVRRVSD